MRAEPTNLAADRTGVQVTGVLLIVTVVGWASAFPAIRAGLAAFGPAELGALRFAIAAVPAALYLVALRPALPRPRDIWRFVFGGVFPSRSIPCCSTSASRRSRPELRASSSMSVPSRWR